MTLTIHDKRPRKGMFQAIKDETRNAAIEECALLVAERAIWTSDRDLKDGLIAVAAAIRALKG